MLGDICSKGLRPVVLAAAVVILTVPACDTAERVTEVITSSPAANPPASSPAAPSPTSDPAIVVETPFANDEVGSPVSVTGSAEAAVDAMLVRILGPDGSELAATVVDVVCDDGCRFEAEVFFFAEERQGGFVEVSASEAPQGPTTIVPVVLAPV